MDGRFCFLAPDRAIVLVTAEKAGFVATRQAVTLIAKAETYEKVVIALVKGSSIGGRILSSSGVPRTGMAVYASRIMTVAGRRYVSQTSSPVVTDDLGEYRFFGLSPGDYVISARPSLLGDLQMIERTPEGAVKIGQAIAARMKQRQVVASVSPEAVLWASELLRGNMPQGAPPLSFTANMKQLTTYYPGVIDPSDASVVSVESGESRENVEFHISMSPTMRVAGRVLQSGSAGLGPVAVSIRSLTPDSLGALPNSPQFAQTQGDGAFSFAEVSPGIYEIAARADSRYLDSKASATLANTVDRKTTEMAAVGGLRPSAGEYYTLSAATTVVIGDSDVGDVILDLRQNVSLQGRVIVEGARYPKLSSPSAIRLTRRYESRQEAVHSDMMTENLDVAVPESGRFSVRGAVPGRYRLQLQWPQDDKQSTGTWHLSSAKLNGVDITDNEFNLTASENAGDLVIVIASGLSTLSGRISDGTGRDVTGIHLVVFAANPSLWESARWVRSTATTLNGRYIVEGLPAGDYFVSPIPDSLLGRRLGPLALQQLAVTGLRVQTQLNRLTTQDIVFSNR